MSMSTHLITVWPKTSPEYKRLSEFAEICNKNSPLKYEYTVQNVMFDAGQGWMSTTIIGKKHDPKEYIDTWQVLCPKDLYNILNPACDLNNYYNIWWEDKYNVERNDIIRLNKKSV